VPKKKQIEVVERLKEALIDHQKLYDLVLELDSMGCKSAVNKLESFQYDIMNYMQFPENHWKKIRIINMRESTNKELKTRSKMLRAFPNQESILKRTSSILIDIKEDWIIGNKY
jgi:transposase-like protein